MKNVRSAFFVSGKTEKKRKTMKDENVSAFPFSFSSFVFRESKRKTKRKRFVFRSSFYPFFQKRKTENILPFSVFRFPFRFSVLHLSFPGIRKKINENRKTKTFWLFRFPFSVSVFRFRLPQHETNGIRKTKNRTRKTFSVVRFHSFYVFFYFPKRKTQNGKCFFFFHFPVFVFLFSLAIFGSRKTERRINGKRLPISVFIFRLSLFHIQKKNRKTIIRSVVICGCSGRPALHSSHSTVIVLQLL